MVHSVFLQGIQYIIMLLLFSCWARPLACSACQKILEETHKHSFISENETDSLIRIMHVERQVTVYYPLTLPTTK